MKRGCAKIYINRALKQRLLPYLIILPAFVLTIGILYPFFLAVYYSLTDYRLISSEINFIGMSNYFDLIKDINFWKSFGLTLLFAALVIIIEIPLGLGVATMLNHEMRGIKLFRFISIIPLMMPPVVAALMWKIIMAENGILNYFLTIIGSTKIAWLANTYSIFSIVLIDVWINTPFCAVILLAGLQSLPKEPFESSRVDGASAFFNFRHLTLPMLKPFLLLTILFRSIDSLKMFDIIYATTKGAHSTMLLQINAYFESFRWYNMGGALAYMMVLWIIIFVISRLLVKWWSGAMQRASGEVKSRG